MASLGSEKKAHTRKAGLMMPVCSPIKYVQVFRQAFNGLQAFGFRTAKTVPGDLFKTADKRLAKRSRTYQVGIFIGLVLDVAKTVSDSVCISEAHR